MRSSVGRLAKAAALFAAGGFLMASVNTGCGSFLAKSALVSTDFCFIFDCQNGLFSGTIDVCSGVGSGNGTIEAQDGLSFFRDCPNAP